MDLTFQVGKLSISMLGGLVLNWFGGVDNSFALLMFLIVVDVITGLMKGVYLKELNADKMFLGALKKITIFIVVSIATQIVRYLGTEIPLREITIMYYILQEGISALQNISIFNSIPPELKKYFEKEGNEKNE